MRSLITLSMLLACSALPAMAATRGGLDTPEGLQELPLAIDGVTGLEIVAPSVTPTQLPQAGETIPNVIIPGNVGIGTVVPNAAFDVNGSAKVGFDAVCSDAKHAGKIRYNSADKTFEGCNGSTWVTFGLENGPGTTRYFGEGAPTGADSGGYDGCAGAGYGFTVTRALDSSNKFVYTINAQWRGDYGGWQSATAANVKTSAIVGGHYGRDSVYMQLIVDSGDNRSHASVLVSACKGSLAIPPADYLWGKASWGQSYAYWLYSFGPSDYLTTNPPL